MPQIRVLADLGQDSDLRLFAEREAEVYSSPPHLKALLKTLTDWGYPRDRGAAGQGGELCRRLPMLDYTYPCHHPAGLSARPAPRPSRRWCWA